MSALATVNPDSCREYIVNKKIRIKFDSDFFYFSSKLLLQFKVCGANIHTIHKDLYFIFSLLKIYIVFLSKC